MPCRPFFDKVTIDLPAARRPLVIAAPGAAAKPYIRSVKVNGRALVGPVLTHADIAAGGRIEFEMSGTPQGWASGTLVVRRTSGLCVYVTARLTRASFVDGRRRTGTRTGTRRGTDTLSCRLASE